jgi:hypothetical protein
VVGGRFNGGEQLAAFGGEPRQEMPCPGATGSQRVGRPVAAGWR